MQSQQILPRKAFPILGINLMMAKAQRNVNNNMKEFRE